MAILAWIVFGLIVGLIARALLPGPQPMGLVTTTLLGVAGSLLGGIVGSLLSGYPVTGMHGAGWIGSVIGAIVVLILVGSVGRRGVGP